MYPYPWKLTARYYIDGVAHEQVATYDRNPRNPLAVLLSGPDLRNGFSWAQNSTAPPMLPPANVHVAIATVD